MSRHNRTTMNLYLDLDTLRQATRRELESYDIIFDTKTLNKIIDKRTSYLRVAGFMTCGILLLHTLQIFDLSTRMTDWDTRMAALEAIVELHKNDTENESNEEE